MRFLIFTFSLFLATTVYANDHNINKSGFLSKKLSVSALSKIDNPKEKIILIYNHGQNTFDKKERTSILTMFQGKRRLSLPFIKLLYMWIIEMQKFRSNINIGDHTSITLGNKTLPVIKENILGSRKGTRMGYYDVISNILDVLDLELDLNNNNDSLEYIGVSRIVIPKAAPKRKADDISHGEESS